MSDLRKLAEAREALAKFDRFIDGEVATLAHFGMDATRPADPDYVTHLRTALAACDRLHDLVRHQRGPLHDAGLLTDEEYAALAADHGAVGRLETIDGLRAKVAEMKAQRDEARAALPKWVREDDHTWNLALGNVPIGGVMGPHPEHGVWGAMATGDDDVTEHPTMDDAARAVCKSIGIPYVAIPQPDDTALAGAKS